MDCPKLDKYSGAFNQPALAKLDELQLLKMSFYAAPESTVKTISGVEWRNLVEETVRLRNK